MYQFTNNANNIKTTLTQPEYGSVKGAKIAANRFYVSKTCWLGIIDHTGKVVSIRIDGVWRSI